jgi:hypothetical protein
MGLVDSHLFLRDVVDDNVDIGNQGRLNSDELTGSVLLPSARNTERATHPNTFMKIGVQVQFIHPYL